MSFQLIHGHCGEIFGRGRDFEQLVRNHIHALVRALRGQYDRDKQLKGRAEIQLAVRSAVHLFKQSVNFFVGRIHANIIAHFRVLCNLFRGPMHKNRLLLRSVFSLLRLWAPSPR